MQTKSVERAVFATDKLTRKENVAEHTFMMSLIFWTIKEDLCIEFPTLNIVKVYDMIQIHDLVEIYTQDISTWTHLDADKSKDNNEAVAAEQIAESLPTIKAHEYKSLIAEIEEHSTVEAKIVKGIDRLSPAIQRLLTKQGWVTEGHTEADLDNIQLSRISFSKTLTSIYDLLKVEAKGLGLLKDAI
jgi:putative hydrolase of HD superfamily